MSVRVHLAAAMWMAVWAAVVGFLVGVRAGRKLEQRRIIRSVYSHLEDES